MPALHLNECATDTAGDARFDDLTHLLAFGEPANREAAANQLASYGGIAAEPLLQLGLRDADEKVRRAAALALYAIATHSATIDWQIPAQIDPELELTLNAGQALGRGEDSASVLEPALHHRDDRVRRAAVSALETLLLGEVDEVDREQYVRLLLDALEHRDVSTRRDVMQVLSKLDLPESVAPLLKRLRAVRRRDYNLVGTIVLPCFIAYSILSILRLSGFKVEPLFSIIVGSYSIVALLSALVGRRRKREATAAELLDTLRALEAQELSLAGGAVRDLRAIDSEAAGHSREARNHARGLIPRVEAARVERGRLPIPAGTPLTSPADLPCVVTEDVA